MIARLLGGRRIGEAGRPVIRRGRRWLHSNYRSGGWTRWLHLLGKQAASGAWLVSADPWPLEIPTMRPSERFGMQHTRLWGWAEEVGGGIVGY